MLASALLAGALFFGGGSDDDGILWVGGGAVVLGGVLLVTAPPPWGWTGRAFFAFLGAFTAWSGMSIVWSIQPDRSWSYLNRELAYLAFATVGLYLASTGARRTAAALAALLGGVLVWALAGKVFPALGPDVDRVARLRSPVGYWNALALLAVMGLALALWLTASSRRSLALRAAGALLAYASVLTIALTYSRGGVALVLVVVAAWLLLGGPVVEALATLALAGVAAVPALAFAFTHPALVDAGQAHEGRVRDGRSFGLLLVAGGALAWFAASFLTRRELGQSPRRRLTRIGLASAGGAAALALAVSTARAGGPGEWAQARWDEFANPVSVQVPQGPGRFAAASSNHRWRWWGKSWESFEDEPVHGTGAGSFDLAHRLYRTEYSPPTRQPHNVALQMLGETGLVGLLLLAGALAAAVVGARATLRRTKGEERAAAAALAVVGLVYVGHILVDSGWDYLAVSAPAFLIAGLLVSGGTTPARRPGGRLLVAAAAGALAIATLSSLAFPWLAERKVDEAVAAIAERDARAGARAAESAHSLNPLSFDPLLKWAVAEELLGDDREAHRLYVDAVRLQPLDPETWYELGAFEMDTRHDCLAAYTYLNRSYTLDRFGPAGLRGGKLDRARSFVDRGVRRC